MAAYKIVYTHIFRMPHPQCICRQVSESPAFGIFLNIFRNKKSVICGFRYVCIVESDIIQVQCKAGVEEIWIVDSQILSITLPKGANLDLAVTSASFKKLLRFLTMLVPRL